MATMMRERIDVRPDETAQVFGARFAAAPLPSWHVERAQLTQALDRGSRLPVTILRAPAGSGKTTAASAWMAMREDKRRNETLCWVTFEAGDDRPNIVWQLVVASLLHGGVDVSSALIAEATGSISRRHLTLLGTALANHRRPVLLVLDGYEVARQRLGADLEFLLDHCGGNLRLMV